ncbi:glutathione S-transferase 1-like [Leptidea sinapis]|uniref:glutathione S-transferase 1-like n=1 Tax=Leptidea sinapis TaxID=189913 RepID=UPI00212AEB64|nr:glutathione S-transferase 1-like [Leptidea sinapis]
MAVLYKAYSSPPVRCVMMVADILNIKYESQEINPLLREQDSPEMTKKNPMRTIPTWEEDNFVLGDSHAIILYLFDKYAKPEHYYLYPKDKQIRAKVNLRLFFDCGVLFPRLRSVMAPTYMGRLTEMSNSMRKNIDDSYRVLEAYLSDTVYLADDVITLADISVVSTLATLNGLRPIDRFPKLKRWYDKMCEEDFVRRINMPGAQEHIEGLLTLMEMNKSKLKSHI